MNCHKRYLFCIHNNITSSEYIYFNNCSLYEHKKDDNDETALFLHMKF